MRLSHSIVVFSFKSLTRILSRIDNTQLTRVPDKGPLILVTNHINILEVPILYTQLQPRPLTGFAVSTRWESFWTHLHSHSRYCQRPWTWEDGHHPI